MSDDFFAHPWKFFALWVLIVAAVFAALALLSGCSGADVGDYVRHNSRAPEYLSCGWAPSEIRELDPVEPGLCWRIAPGENRALSLVDDACAAESAPIETPGGRVYVWAPLGSSDLGSLKCRIQECTP